ncbi:MAG TPA: TolC family protein, partial [Planctomycetes bacterium]|nr:TolC family protein [Planctomycetota bacterium]
MDPVADLRSMAWRPVTIPIPIAVSVLLWAGLPGSGAPAQEPWRVVLPEQRHLRVRPPGALPQARLPDVPAPWTVTNPHPEGEGRYVSLDEAIRIALENSEAIRVLAGVGTAASGATIYDPAIVNTGVDEARAVFDPSVQVDNTFQRHHNPVAGFDPGDPSQVIIGGDPTHDYLMSMGLSKRTVTGGTAGLRARVNPARTEAEGLPLNPESRSSLEFSYVQPLFQGGGYRANVAPIVIARIDTERSFFQMKSGVERLVLGVIQAYWELVFARTEVWVRTQQVAEGQEALDLAQARLEVGMGNLGDVAQARAALAGFRASLVTAQANAIQWESALRDMLGLPPADGPPLAPSTPPSALWLAADWQALVALAERYRPDIIELKLVLEADQQHLLLARNQALPRVDAVALYRWNGLAGRTPDRRLSTSGAGEFPEWQLGVNFSVPIGLRQERAALRRQELIVLRDRANLDEALHRAVHQVATAYRNLAQLYEEYKAFQEARKAARVNLEFQSADYRAGRTILLNVLQAITDWANAVNAEARALTRYNTELANLEVQTGTILQSHGIRFVEERLGFVGPLGPLGRRACYPASTPPGANVERYEAAERPAEQFFHLEAPRPPRRSR